MTALVIAAYLMLFTSFIFALAQTMAFIFTYIMLVSWCRIFKTKIITSGNNITLTDQLQLKCIASENQHYPWALFARLCDDRLAKKQHYMQKQEKLIMQLMESQPKKVRSRILRTIWHLATPLPSAIFTKPHKAALYLSISSTLITFIMYFFDLTHGFQNSLISITQIVWPLVILNYASHKQGLWNNKLANRWQQTCNQFQALIMEELPPPLPFQKVGNKTKGVNHVREHH